MRNLPAVLSSISRPQSSESVQPAYLKRAEMESKSRVQLEGHLRPQLDAKLLLDSTQPRTLRARMLKGTTLDVLIPFISVLATLSSTNDTRTSFSESTPSLPFLMDPTFLKPFPRRYTSNRYAQHC